MNKILVVEDNKKIKDGEYLINYQNDTSITIDGSVILHEYSKNNYNLNIELLEESNLKLDKVNILKESINININIKDYSTLDYSMLIINEGINKVIINVNMLGNNSKAIIKLRVINKTNNSGIAIECNGKVLENTINNELLEDLKGLILNEDSIKISPNMEVNTNEVMANHLVTIGSFNKEDLFYLTSRGLSEKTAKELLIESFTTNIISDEFKEKIKMEVISIE